MEKNRFKMVAVLAFVLFVLSSFIYKNSICCMFAASRSFGFPGQYIMLNKETDLLADAEKVNQLSSWELLQQGWQIRFATTANSTISSIAPINMAANAIFWLTISLAIMKLIKISRKYFKK